MELQKAIKIKGQKLITVINQSGFWRYELFLSKKKSKLDQILQYLASWVSLKKTNENNNHFTAITQNNLC